MNDSSAPEARKRRLADSFNALAATYDQLHFLKVSAARLMEHASLPEGSRVLDVATGTGVIALAAAARVGPTGRVVGIDLAPEMLARARKKLAETGFGHVEFRVGDTERLEFPDRSFDVVLCSSSLFFVPDMPAAVREWRRVLSPGGTVVFSSYELSFLQPLRGLWAECLRRHGANAGVLPIDRLAESGACETLLNEAGFTSIGVHSEQLGYHLASPEDRWADITAGLEGKPLMLLPPAEREQVRVEHLAELQALAIPEGIWVDVPVLFAGGRNPG